MDNPKDLENVIKSFVEDHKCTYIDIKNEKSIKKIYNLFFDHIFVEPENGIEYLYFGWFYQYAKKDYEQMKKYYLMAIDKGVSEAMYILGYYYEHIDLEKDYEQMKKYYLMAIDKGVYKAMFNLGYYYEHIKKDYEQMKKFYLMASDKGDSQAMNNLTTFYKNNNDYPSLIKLYHKYNKKEELIKILFTFLQKSDKSFTLDEELVDIFISIDISTYNFPLSVKLLQKTLKEKID